MVTSPGNKKIVFGIFRKTGGAACDFSVVAELQLGRSNIDALLSPKTDGIVEVGNLLNIAFTIV